jgi:hypothetical protein
MMTQSAAVPEFQNICYVLIADKDNQRVLLMLDKKENRFALPSFVTAEQHPWHIVEHINQIVLEQFGVVVTTLRCIYTARDPENQQVINVYAMENHSPNWELSAGMQWFGRDGLSVIVPGQWPVLNAWFDWMETPASALRVPWYNPGWFDEATQWISQQLDRLGYIDYATSSTIEQECTWEYETTLRINTSAGHVHFRAVPEIFNHEVMLTLWLSSGYPSKLPQLLDVDLERGWLLVRGTDGVTLDQVEDIGIWEKAVGAYSRLQADLVIETENLLAAGCADWQLDNIEAEIDKLLDDVPAMLPGQEEGLSESEINTLRQLGPRLKEMCAELEDCGVPCSLEHGDLNPGHIVSKGASYVFLKWAHSSLSHPFFSLGHLLDYLEDAYTDFPAAAYVGLINAYLEPWKTYAPPERLAQAVELARPLAALHHALRYRCSILPWMEVKWEVEQMVPFYLKKLLHHMQK